MTVIQIEDDPPTYCEVFFANLNFVVSIWVSNNQTKSVIMMCVLLLNCIELFFVNIQPKMKLLVSFWKSTLSPRRY